MVRYVGEYQYRKTLAELGYRFDPGKLSARKATIFQTIASAYSDVCDEKQRAKSEGQDV